MSYANSAAFAEKRDRARSMGAARRAAFERELAGVELEAEAEASGYSEMSADSFAFAMETGVEPEKVSANVIPEDK